MTTNSVTNWVSEVLGILGSFGEIAPGTDVDG